MQTKQGNVLQSLLAVEAFIEQHAGILDGVVKSGALQSLKQLIADLSMHTASQVEHVFASEGGTKNQAVLRTILMRDHMTPIARIAKANNTKVPQVEPLRMPRGRPTSTRLAATAHGMANAAEPYAATFIEAGLAPDFVQQLREAANEMLKAITDRTQSRGSRARATTGLKGKLSDGRKLVHVLDSFIRSTLSGDKATLSAWNAVKRVQKTGIRSQPAAIVPTTAAA